jgi:hypothetical protein
MFSDYPAGAAFSKSTYKIYAVYWSRRYKSYIFWPTHSAGRIEIAGRHQYLALRNQALRQETEIDILRLAIMWRAGTVRVLLP